MVTHGISKMQLFNKVKQSGVQDESGLVALRADLLKEIKESKINSRFSEEIQATVREKFDFSDVKADSHGLIPF